MDKDNKPSYVCFDCGGEYLTDKQNKEVMVVTAHLGICGICEKTKSVTHIRNFNYLNKKK